MFLFEISYFRNALSSFLKNVQGIIPEKYQCLNPFPYSPALFVFYIFCMSIYLACIYSLGLIDKNTELSSVGDR